MIETEQLIALCKREDSQAQQELYDRYKSYLMGICQRYTANRDEAQDVLQDSFIKIFMNIHQLDSAEKLKSWITRITINTAINYYHHELKHNLREDLTKIDVDGRDYEEILSNLSDEFLIGLINTLPHGCRVVFNLFVVEGFSHAEIAEILKISASTSRSQLVYAKNILKKRLTILGLIRYEKYG